MTIHSMTVATGDAVKWLSMPGPELHAQPSKALLAEERTQPNQGQVLNLVLVEVACGITI